jgi:hypothetical protein
MAKTPPHKPDAPDPGPDQAINTRKPLPMGQPDHPHNTTIHAGIPTTEEIRNRIKGK